MGHGEPRRGWTWTKQDPYTPAMDAPPTGRSQRKPRGQGQSRRAEILDAAKRLFLTDGYENATIRKIAAAVGVSDTGFALTAAQVAPDARAGAQSTTAVSTMGCD